MDKLPTGVKSSLFADDMVIYYTSRRHQTAERMLQIAIGTLLTWTRGVNLNFSASKTVAVHFQKRNRKREDLPQGLYLNGREIPVRESVRFLGVILDKRITWKDHITELKAETMRAMNLIRVIAGVNFGADPSSNYTGQQ